MELVISESLSSSSLPSLKVEAVLVLVNGVPVGETDMSDDVHLTCAPIRKQV